MLIKNIVNKIIFFIFGLDITELPKWVKYALSFYIIILSFLNENYLKLCLYILFLIIFIFYIVELILLYLFKNNKITISKLLPNFIIEHLDFIKFSSQTKEYFNDYKNGIYINLSIYVVMFIFIYIIS